MRLGQTSLLYFFSKFLATIIGFVGTIYFTRTLGEEIYGIYILTLTIVSWIGLIKTIGFTDAIAKRLSEGKDQEQYFTAGIIILFSLTGIAILIIYIFQQQINQYLGEPLTDIVILLLVAAVLNEFVDSGLHGTHNVHIYSVLAILKQFAQMVLMVVFVFTGYGLLGLLYGYAIGTVIATAIGFIILSPKLAFPQKKHFIRLFDFAKYSWIGSLQRQSFRDADILILGLFVQPALTGVYAVAYNLSKFLEIFGSGIKSTMFPEMSKQSSQENMNTVVTLTHDSLRFAGLFVIPGVAGSLVLGDRLMLIYGPGFVVGQDVLVILLLSLLMYTYTRQLLNTLNAIDRPDLAFRANGIFIFVNIVLNVVLVYHIGWVGAAIATTLSASIGFCMAMYYIRQIFSLQFPTDEIALQILSAAVMGILIYFLRVTAEVQLNQFVEYNFIFVLFVVSFGAAVYFVTYLTFSTRFRKTVVNNLPSQRFITNEE